jgi:hypothetical protein
VVGAERGIWTEPNADFIPIFSKDRFITLKAFDRVGRQVMLHPPSLGAQPERHTGTIADAFDRVTTYIHRTEGELLRSSEDIIAAVLSHAPLIARTQFETDRYIANLEYPVKTINACERDNIYQTDTGPVLFPDLSREPDSLIEGMDLAFCAFNCPGWAEFLLRVPKSIEDHISVLHYSRSIHLDTKNHLIRL